MKFWAFTLVLLPAMAQDSARDVMDRAVADFAQVRIADSVRGFDRLALMAPQSAPHLWQRGIALYYAGRYSDCRKQFEAHRTVNPNDVENAAWHYLCVARAESPARARAALLPVGPDGRSPMHEVLALFAGKLSPADVMRAAGSSPDAVFYAHLYIALFAEATGDSRRALEEIRLAAHPKFAEAGGYMHMVARVHLRLRERPAATQDR